MEKDSLIDSFGEFKEQKGIDTETLIRILKDVIKGLFKKNYGTDENIDIILNPDKGDLEIWRNREIVEDDTENINPGLQVTYSEAILVEPDFEVGEELSEEVHLSDFGRRDILAIKQNLLGKIQEYDRSRIYKKYEEKIGSIIVCEVSQTWKREITLKDEEGNELFMPKSEQIPGDFFIRYESIKGIVSKVEMRNGIPYVTVSRTDPMFLERLFESEVPEIFDGLITIRKTVRQPGERAKIAVESYDDRIDPVGACVGSKGARIHGIVRELRNENIDVINYTSNAELYVKRALAPAEVISVVIDENAKKADVYMKPEQVSLAIGKGGYNIQLASKLTGYEIDIYRDSDKDFEEDDVDLQEFSDEIELWVIEALRNIGCDTAKDVLALSKEDVAERADLEAETVDNVFKILKAEFELEDEDENEQQDEDKNEQEDSKEE